MLTHNKNRVTSSHSFIHYSNAFFSFFLPHSPYHNPVVAPVTSSSLYSLRIKKTLTEGTFHSSKKKKKNMSIPVDYLPEGCEPRHRTADLGLSLAVLAGLFLSYLPQHFRIIHSKSSDGISPWFMLLGCLSATSSLLNILILQWRVLQCCRYVVRYVPENNKD